MYPPPPWFEVTPRAHQGANLEEVNMLRDLVAMGGRCRGVLRFRLQLYIETTVIYITVV